MPTREPVEGLSLIVAGNARSLRARLRLRQRDVAARAGIPPATLSLIEGERRRVSLDDALALCEGLETQLNTLLAGADPQVLRRFGLHP